MNVFLFFMHKKELCYSNESFNGFDKINDLFGHTNTVEIHVRGKKKVRDMFFFQKNK